MDNESSARHDAALYISNMSEWQGDTSVLNYGAIVFCRKGYTDLTVNFESWHLKESDGIVLFPDDVVMATGTSDDFSAEVLRYDPSLLREASLQLEHTVYSLLRQDRCRGDSPIVTSIMENMFGLLRVFFSQPDCRCVEQVVLFELKVLFIGFYDFIQRNPQEWPEEKGTRRTNELFSNFMASVAHHYMESRDVAYYAERQHISPKYLGQIVRSKTSHSPKVIIDQYVTMQLKLLLHTSSDSIKQIAWRYHFNDVSFFCRYFKLQTGMTPQQFRKVAVQGSTAKKPV